MYHGVIMFPKDYPWKPPEIKMLTPTGKFGVGINICLSMSSYHPETWNVRSLFCLFISSNQHHSTSINTAAMVSQVNLDRFTLFHVRRGDSRGLVERTTDLYSCAEKGVCKEIIELQLTEDEKALLYKSAEAVRGVVDTYKNMKANA